MPSFIVADDESIASRVRSVLGFHYKDGPGPEVVPIALAPSRLAREKGVDLVIAVLPMDPAAALELLTRLAPAARGGLLAVGPAADARFVLQALRAGVRDYLDRGDLEAELAAALGRLAAGSKAEATLGRVIAVLGPSGGAGASTVAANLGVALAALHGSAGLVDLNLEAGDLAALLDLKPNYSLADLCKNASSFDRVMLERTFAKHASGVSLLAPPSHLVDARLVRPEGVSRAIDLARSLFPVVVVDVDHSYRDEQVAALRLADVLLLVLRLDFNSLRNAHRALEHLNRLGLAGDRVRTVVNRAGLAMEVPRAKAEEALGGPIAHVIPEDAKAVTRANNNGVPVVIEAPSSKAAKSLVRLAQSLRVAEPAGPGATSRAVGHRGPALWRLLRRKPTAAAH